MILKPGKADTPKPLTACKAAPLAGIFAVPGDKSISHRAIMLGGLAEGVTTVHGLLEGEDVLHTAVALRQLGAKAERQANGSWRIEGTGGALRAPSGTLDMGNSGTAARLLMGLVATHPFDSKFDGDASLRKRPMARVMEPLVRMGANFFSAEGGRMPLTIMGAQKPHALDYRLPVASAQVKSAILLAALNAPGTTTVIEPASTRDHTENMLRHFGAELHIAPAEGGGSAISITSPVKLRGGTVQVPADPSSAAFPLVAALIGGGTLALPGIGINPRRSGLFVTLAEMGAALEFTNTRDAGGEPVADIAVRPSTLQGIDVPAERAPSMIDEYPILAAAAACAGGTTRMRGLGELRVKESDRLAMIAKGLEVCGVKVEIEGDDLIVHGTGKPPQGPAPGGAKIETAMDHRIAMSFLVLGGVTAEPVQIDDGSFIDTSFPGFVDAMNKCGAKIGA
ncbi:MAG: 3-phosphoshikimate 1-carboxyvinyltransferase [Alphaproteobacteria bacterium]|nr:3-phosphoshikimate 1-carboxyvinyltransferase [Alphaproteobacteria bacterium]